MGCAVMMMLAGGCSLEMTYVNQPATPTAAVEPAPTERVGILGTCSTGSAEGEGALASCAAGSAAGEGALGSCSTSADDDCCNDPVVPQLTTHDFESGRVTMRTADVGLLEIFLADLNRRKDYAFACHNGRSTPTSEYLWRWVQRTVHELERRGYTMDAQGNLWEGNRMVTMR
jgi:hypothetical protein